MNCRRLTWRILALAASGLASIVWADPAPGLIYVHTVRANTTLTATGAAARPLLRGESFAATGQALTVPSGQALALVLSNGAAAYMPDGGRLTVGEFTQEPVTDQKKDPTYEPSRSNLSLKLDAGTLVVTSRIPVPTSTFTLTTPLAQFKFHSSSELIVQVKADSVIVTLDQGTADLLVPETGFTETLQKGQTATLTRETLHQPYPLKLDRTTTVQGSQFGQWVALARWATDRVDFNFDGKQWHPSLVVPFDFTQQTSADDPRFR